MADQIKQFEGQTRDPDKQFQIGERVLYIPDGIYAIVEGYLWLQAVGELPRVVAYRLSCGISVPGNTIEAAEKT